MGDKPQVKMTELREEELGSIIICMCTERQGKLMSRDRQAKVQEVKRPFGPTSWFQALSRPGCVSHPDIP